MDYVTSEQFDEAVRLLLAARRADEMARMPGLTLAQKLTLKNSAKQLRAQVLAMKWEASC